MFDLGPLVGTAAAAHTQLPAHSCGLGIGIGVRPPTLDRGFTTGRSPRAPKHLPLGGGAALAEATMTRDSALRELFHDSTSIWDEQDSTGSIGGTERGRRRGRVTVRLVCFERPPGPLTDGVEMDELDRLLGNNDSGDHDGLDPLPRDLAVQVSRLQQLFLPEEQSEYVPRGASRGQFAASPDVDVAAIYREGSSRDVSVPPWEDTAWLHRLWLGHEQSRGFSSTQARADLDAWHCGARRDTSDPSAWPDHASPCLSPEVDRAAAASGRYSKSPKVELRPASRNEDEDERAQPYLQPDATIPCSLDTRDSRSGQDAGHDDSTTGALKSSMGFLLMLSLLPVGGPNGDGDGESKES